MMNRRGFERLLNSEREEAGPGELANPRQPQRRRTSRVDPAVTPRRRLDFYPYLLISGRRLSTAAMGVASNEECRRMGVQSESESAGSARA